MRELRRIISMLLILVLFIGIMPMNLGVVKAEAELDEINKVKDIRARVYDGNKWEVVSLTAVVNNKEEKKYKEFKSDIKNYKLYLDPKYEKIQFIIKKNSDEQELNAKFNGDIYKIDANDNGDIVTIRPGTSILSVKVNKDVYSEYIVSINKPGVGKLHRLCVTNGSAEFHEAYEGDIVTISADGSYKKVFDRWVKVEGNNIIEIEVGDSIIKEPNKTPTELRMPNHNLTIKPIFKESVVSDSNLRNIILYGLEDEVWKNQKSKLVFNKEQKTYSVDLSDDYSEAYVYFQFGDNKQTISATLNDDAIVLDDESNLYKNGYKTEKLELNDGENIFKIIVTSEDKKNTSEYTLIVNRGEVKYKVSFDPGEGSGEMSDIKIEKGKDFELPECDFIAPYGQEFKAWEVDSIEYPAKTNIKINKKTIVKAVWKDIEYKITFDKTEGSGEMDEQVVKAGKEFTLPENDFTAPGNKEFAGWKIGEDEKKPGDILIINKDTEVKALWKDIMFKVSIVPGEGTGETIVKEFIKGSTYELPECIFEAPANKEFAGWKIGEDEKKPGDILIINKDTEVKAIWKDIMFKVSLVPGKGTGEAIVKEFVKGSTYKLPECTFEAPANKEFKAWRVNGEEKAVDDEITIDADTEITAFWKDIMFKVSIVPGEGTGEATVDEIKKGTEYTLPDCPFEAPANKEFKSWKVNGEEKAVGDVITINDNTEITAIWRDKPIEKYKVTLVANNGTDKTIVDEIKKGTEYTLPDCSFTAPDGQVFKAWELDGQEYKPQTTIKIDKETEIKAIWQENPDKPNPDDTNPDKPIPDKPNTGDEENPDKPNPGEEPKPDEENPDKPNPDETEPDEDNPGEKPNPDKPNQKHAINITPSPYGEVIIDPREAKAGDKVTVRAIAKYGYELVSLSVCDASGELLPITNDQFIMPDGEVSIFPIFREIAPYTEPEIYDKAEREEQKRRHRRDYYHEEEKDEDEAKTIDKAKEEKQKESKVLITIGSEMLDKVDNGVRTLKAMDTKPYIKVGRTMLPLRYIAEALGYRVAWLIETRTAVIMDLGLRVEVSLDSNFIIVNGVKYTSDVKPEIVNNRIMLPIANIARALGLKDGKDILWDEVNMQVTLIRNFNTK